MTAKEAEKLILKDGWYFVGSKGSHRQYKHKSKPGKVTVPFHPGDISMPIVNSILKQAKLK
ncbi:MAG: type II toxin-antitoxin system HicA family toxin [Oscillospiraceae bacterium]|nr:type II toxin-antitoxin system HicA family toxin [Oscillospiraceae bacterium]